MFSFLLGGGAVLCSVRLAFYFYDTLYRLVKRGKKRTPAICWVPFSHIATWVCRFLRVIVGV